MKDKIIKLVKDYGGLSLGVTCTFVGLCLSCVCAHDLGIEKYKEAISNALDTLSDEILFEEYGIKNES